MAALRLYEILKEKKNMGLSQQVSAFSYKKWAEEIEEAYGPAAPEVLKLEQEVGKNADNEVLRRRSVWEEKQEEIGSVLENLPSAKTVAQILKSMGAPSSPAEIQVSLETFKKGIYFAKDLRNRFGLLQILFDFSLQKSFIEGIG